MLIGLRAKKHLISVITLGTDRKLVWIPGRYPDLSAERYDRQTHHKCFCDLVLRSVVREQVMVAFAL